MVDILVVNHGTLVGFIGQTDEGREFLSSEVQSESYQWDGTPALRRPPVCRQSHRRNPRERSHGGGVIMRDISVNETSKLIKQTLRKAFPGTKFSVRLDKYSMGCSIDASWTDGPTDRQVNDILDRFNGNYFDGMDDSTHYVGKRIWNGEQVDFHSGYVRGQRRCSQALVAKVAARVAQETGIPAPVINEHGYVDEHHNLRVPFQWHSSWMGCDGKSFLTLADLEAAGPLLAHDSHEDEYFTRLIDRIAQHVSCEAQQPVDLPEYLPDPEDPRHDEEAVFDRAAALQCPAFVKDEHE